MNVLLVRQDVENQNELLPEVLRHLQQMGEEHRSRLVYDIAPTLKHFLWTLGLPTVVISFYRLRCFYPEWATLWTQPDLSKSEEYILLEQRGIPVPPWAVLRQDEVPDLSRFHDFVVVKPDRGAFGAMVRVMRKSRLRWQRIEIKNSGVMSDALMIQEYIHTGPWPTCYRVGTVFGEPIYAWRTISDHTREPFQEGLKDERFFAGKTIVAASRGCTMDTQVPEGVIELAKQAHDAFPTIPLLGTDIIRDYVTGKLYILEVNATGGTFHLTSEIYQRIKAETGIDLRHQFGGARAVARGIYNRLKRMNPKYSLPLSPKVGDENLCAAS